MASCNLNLSPKHNWIEDAGGLPEFMADVACALIRSGHDETSAIKIAVGQIENWASGKGKVNAKTRAKAAAAVAEWEAKRAKSHASVKASNIDQDIFEGQVPEGFDDSIFKLSDEGEVKLRTSLEKIVELARKRVAAESVVALASPGVKAKADANMKKPASKTEYGDVAYGDPKNKKYPLNSAGRVKAAWDYINVEKNAAQYPLNGVSLSSVKSRIKAAAKKFGIQIND